MGDGDRTQKEDDLRPNEPSPTTRTRRSSTTPGNQFNVHETGLLPGRMDHQFASFIKRQETDSIYSHDGFWTRLSEEIDGLKQLIEGPSDDEDEPYGSTATSPASKYDSPSHFVFDLKVTSSNILIAYPSVGHNEVLLSYYFKNVHPMITIEHKQTTHIMARSNSELFDPNTGRHKFKSLEASLFAVAFAAVTSMTDEECVEHFDEEREVLVTRYKTATEIALQESDFLNSVEIVTLQALIIYIVSILFASDVQISDSSLFTNVSRRSCVLMIEAEPYGHLLDSQFVLHVLLDFIEIRIMGILSTWRCEEEYGGLCSYLILELLRIEVLKR